MLIVISPAKNLDYDSPLPSLKPTQPQMLSEAEILIDGLRKLAPHEISSLMHISDKLGLLNYERYQQWQRPFTHKNARPALLAFNGDVYQSMRPATFDEADFCYAQDHLRILSGLYGLLRPLDLIQPYRLEMGTRFGNARGRDLYQFWGDSISSKLNQQLRKLDSRVLINLASQEYFKAVNLGSLKAQVIEPQFKEWKNGQYKTFSFSAKKARGLMSAYIIKNQLKTPDQIKQFDWEGYGYNQAMSSAGKWVFTRGQ